jgi:hypothetical protein
VHEPVPLNEHRNGRECRKVMADLVGVGVGYICFLALLTYGGSVLGLPHSDTRDVTVSGPLVY